MTASNLPICTLTGHNYFKIISIIALVLIAFVSFSLIKYVGFTILFLGLYCLSMILFIKFPRINVYEDHFDIVKKSVYYKQSDQISYNYNEITSIRFSKGYTNWIMIGITFLISGGKLHGDEQYSKPDTMILTFAGYREIEINRIGSRDNFIGIIEIIKTKINVANGCITKIA